MTKKVHREWRAIDPDDLLPEFGFVRLSTVLQVLPVDETTWWEGVKSGRFPKPVPLEQRRKVWEVEDIRRLVEAYEQSSIKKEENNDQ